MDCSEVRAFWKEVPDETIRVLVHSAFPGMIGRGNKDLGVPEVGSFPMSGELFAVVIGNGVHLGAQRFQAMHRSAVRGLGRGRDSCEMVVNRLLRSTCVSRPP